MNKSDISNKLAETVRKMFEGEHEIFLNDVSERAIAHRFACRLSGSFPEWNVDCEYNRIGEGRILKQIDDFDFFKKTRVKKLIDLALEGNSAVEKYLLNAKPISVFPDIIIHRRGLDGMDNNLVVIEIKKTTNTDKRDGDEEKLKFFTNQSKRFKYQFGLFLEFAAGTIPKKSGKICANATWYTDGTIDGTAETLAEYAIGNSYSVTSAEQTDTPH